MAKRRGNNEGSIYRRPDGLWAAVMSVGYSPNGKLKRKAFYAKTRKEAVEKMDRALQELRRGTYVEPTHTFFGEWLDKWLGDYKRGQLRPGTYQSYQTLVRVHIKPALGRIPLAKLQSHMLQSFYNEKLKSGRSDSKGGLSTRMVRYLHAVIRQALQQAVKEGLLPRNVADATSPPTVQSKQIRPLTEEELLSFLAGAKEDRLFPAYVLAATTGLRRGELLGLEWGCVDLEQGVITVQRQLVVLTEGPVLEETAKSKCGKRNIALTDDAIQELKRHRKTQLQEKLLLGEAYQDHGLVFCREDGTFLDPREFTKRFQRHLRREGLPRVRLHDLRHTHASLLLARGVHPKIVQERLGHSTITMTLDLYSHLFPGLQEAAAATLNGLLSKERPKPAKKVVG